MQVELIQRLHNAYGFRRDTYRFVGITDELLAEAWKDRDKKYGEFELVDEDQRLSHLWVIDVESKKTKRLTKGDFTVGGFSWSPDGNRIAYRFWYGNSAHATIWSVSIDGRDPRQITTETGVPFDGSWDGMPAWSRDGQSIAFEAYRPTQGIWLVPSAGGPVRQLTFPGGNAPAWSPGGDHLAFLAAMQKRLEPVAWFSMGLLLAGQPARAAQDNTHQVIVLTADGPITTAMAQYLSRGIQTAEKRGADFQRLTLDENIDKAVERSEEILALDRALEGLAALDEQKARIVELRYFGGLTVEETAEVLGVTPITIKRHWRMARAWLYGQMTQS